VSRLGDQFSGTRNIGQRGKRAKKKLTGKSDRDLKKHNHGLGGSASWGTEARVGNNCGGGPAKEGGGFGAPVGQGPEPGEGWGGKHVHRAHHHSRGGGDWVHSFGVQLFKTEKAQSAKQNETKEESKWGERRMKNETTFVGWPWVVFVTARWQREQASNREGKGGERERGVCLKLATGGVRKRTPPPHTPPPSGLVFAVCVEQKRGHGKK